MPVNLAAKLPKAAQIGLFAGGVAAAVGLTRYLKSKRGTSTLRLAEALLDTALLEEARRSAHSEPEQAITACAGYLIHLLHESTDCGALAQSSISEPTIRRTHPYSGARCTVFVDRRHGTISALYTMDFDGVVSARGSRSIGPVRMDGITPARKLNDRLQIDLGEERSIQIESETTAPDYVATGANRLSGEMTLDDNRGLGGSVTLLPSGEITGVLRRGARVIGRISGSFDAGIRFLSFTNSAGDTAA